MHLSVLLQSVAVCDRIKAVLIFCPIVSDDRFCELNVDKRRCKM